MNGWKVSALAISMAAMGHAQQNFNIYGFLDFEVQQRVMSEGNNLLLSESFLSENTDIRLQNLNLYMDFNPNDKTRALVEVNFADSPGDDAEVFRMANGTVELEPVTAEMYYSTVEALVPEGTPGRNEIIAAQAQSIADGVNTSAGLIAGGFNQAAGTATLNNPSSKKKYHGVNIERAWVDLSLSDEWTLKAGKFITPAGIWAVDHGSPVITTVAQPNQTDFFPIFPTRQTGLMASGSYYVGDHDLEVVGYVSSGRDQDENVISEFDDIGYGGKLAMNLDMLDGIHFGVSGFGGTLKRESRQYNINTFVPAEELALIMGNPAVQADPTGAVLTGEIQNYIATKNDFAVNDYTVKTTQKLYDVAYGAELKVDVNGFTLQGEVNGRQLIDEMNNDATMSYFAWYTLFSYTSYLTENVSITPYGFVENISWEDPENVPAGGLATIPLDGWTQYAAGLNFSFYNNYRLKLEAQQSVLNVDNSLFESSTLEQGDLDIQTYAAQITVAF
jgi:hypothetical protein